jgi:four helix bundle protein
MAKNHDLRVLDAARMVVDDINRLIRAHKLPNAAQLRNAAESITGNIQEALGREAGPDRNRFWTFARASAEEANERLRARFAAMDVNSKDYWRNHHRLVAIVRMLNPLMDSS